MYGKEENIKKVILTDLDSHDKTMQMLKELKQDEDSVKVDTWKECKNVMDMIDDS